MLLEVLEKARTEFITAENKKSHLATCIDHGWHLFNKYYKLTDIAEEEEEKRFEPVYV